MISRSPIGIFVFDNKRNVQKVECFSKQPEKAIEHFLEAEEGNEELVRENFRKEALKHFSEEELNSFLSNFYILLSKKLMSGAIGKDKLIIQASNALEEMAKISNTLLMRTTEWFSLHYPELKENNEKIAELIAEHGRRENWPRFKSSLGVEMDEKDESMVQKFASLASEAHSQKTLLEKYVKKSLKQIAPNFSSLVEPLLAARVLAAAGSLEKLAKMSASSIQIIGAEKALFRHLRKKGRAPKYGMIYVSNWIQNAPEERRGKVARVLATKLMVAVRIDYFSGRDESAKLKRELTDDVKKVIGV